MSITHTHQVECECGATVALFCADSLNAERHPHFRDAIMARTFHAFRCGACGAALAVDKRMLYIDLPNHQFYGLFPETERARERACSEEVVSAWHVSLGDGAPVSVAALFQTDRFHVRTCFGIEELREKIVAHAAGLRDLVLEVLKGELLAGNPDWAQAGVRTLRLDHVEPDGQLAFFLEQAPRDPNDMPTALDVGILTTRDRYDELAQIEWSKLLADHPWVASGPHVSLLRLAVPEVAEAVRSAKSS